MTMHPLEPPDSHHLAAAEGWLELSNPVEANDELEKITPIKRAHPDVLKMRVRIYLEARKWEMALPVCEALVKSLPENPFGWIHRSYALHELKRTQEAYDLLIPAETRFPHEWVVPYNLACYQCQLGRLPEARSLLTKALELDPFSKRKMQALEDPDLAPLWAKVPNK